MSPTRLLPVTLVLLAACDGARALPQGQAAAPLCPAPGPLDDVLSLPDVQALGTHNSYHLRPERILASEWDYDQPTLTDQFALHGVRQIEIDVHLSVDGVFEVFHLPNVDAETTCPLLADCLGEVKTWLDTHPCSLPIVVWIEPKDDIDVPEFGYLPLDGHVGKLDQAILDVFPREQVITPDDVRGDAATLPAAIVERGWPSLGLLRGRALFALLDSSEARTEYLEGNPTLAGRVLFADSDAVTDPWAAMFKIDDAVGGADLVRGAARSGFIVTSNAGGASSSAEEAVADVAGTLEAGAHFTSTDAVVPREDGFVAVVPGGVPARCNPVSADPRCTPEALEDLPR